MTARGEARGRQRVGKVDRRQLILKTTLEMIASGGIDSVTHRRVAEAAGIPLGSTTYYFDSREHLLRETFDYYIREVAEAQAEGPGPDVKNVQELVDNLVTLTEREFEHEAMLLAEYEMTLFAARDPVVAESLRAWDEMLISGMAESMRSLGAANPTDAARTLLHLMRGYELERLTRHDPDPADLRRRLTPVVNALV